VETTKGIVYVATKKERYLAEAFLSATSAKELVPEIPVSVFTNLTDSIFAHAPCFDTVIPLESVEGFGKTWSEGQLDRIRSLPNSPFDFTLHLDTDTRIRNAELKQAFDLLEHHDIAMVECSEDNSYSCEKYGRPMFNAGFILFRKSAGVLDLLRQWESKTEAFFGLACSKENPDVDCLAHIDDPDIRRKLLFMDQISLVQLLSPDVNECGVNFQILDERWNYRGSNAGRPPPERLIVDHHPINRKVFFVRDLILAAMRYRNEANRQFGLDVLRWTDRQFPGRKNVMKLLVVSEIDDGNYNEALIHIGRILDYFPGSDWARSAKLKVNALLSHARENK
jgi:hypothetical protein